MSDAIYRDVERLYNSVAAKLGSSGTADVRSPMLANIPVNETELAACLVTLGVPLRHPAPFTDCDQDDGRRIKTWWLGAGSDSGHKTEDIVAAWWFPERMKAEHPMHPLNPMREALGSRNWWLAVKHREIHAPQFAEGFMTDSLRALAQTALELSEDINSVEFVDFACVALPKLAHEYLDQCDTLDSLKLDAASGAGHSGMSTARRLHEDFLAMRDKLAIAREALDAARSVLSEDGVKEYLSSYVMGVELIDRLEKIK